VKKGLLFDDAGPVRPLSPTSHRAQQLEDLPGTFLGHRGHFLRFDTLHRFQTGVVIRRNFFLST
jgi:hypothetical protein